MFGKWYIEFRTPFMCGSLWWPLAMVNRVGLSWIALLTFLSFLHFHGWSCSYEQSCHLLKTSLAAATQLNCATGGHRYRRPLALLHQIMTRRSCKNIWQKSQEVLLFLRYMLEVWWVFFCKSSQICTACKSFFFHFILGEPLYLPFVWVTQMVLLIADWWSKWRRG